MLETKLKFLLEFRFPKPTNSFPKTACRKKVLARLMQNSVYLVSVNFNVAILCSIIEFLEKTLILSSIF